MTRPPRCSAARAAVLTVLALAVYAHATYDINWYTIDAGTVPTFSPAGLALEATVGQPDATAAPLTGGSFELRGGFRTTPPAAPPQPGDCNGNGIVDLQDFAVVAECLLGPLGGIQPDCTCVDVDRDQDADLHDFAVLQQSLSTP